MIEFPLELGILCWVSTLVFVFAFAMVVYGIVKALKK